MIPTNVGRIILLILLSAIAAAAQTPALHGTVTDPSGSTIPNAQITAGPTHSTHTDGQGNYRMNLPAGTWSIQAEAPGFTSVSIPNYALSNNPSPLNISLTLRTQAQQLTVAEDAAPTITPDPSGNAGALVLQGSDLAALPDDPDDLTSDLQALAGPAAGPNGGQFFIDGFTGGHLPPKQNIREIRINQNPFAAQFDHPGQGRVEIFTKPGTEELHGQVEYIFTDAAFNARNPFVAVKPPYRRAQLEAEISAALNKKTSINADFVRRDVNDNAVVNAVILDAALNPTAFSQGIVAVKTGLEFDGRLDRQLSTNNTLSLRYSYERDTNDNGGVGGFSLPERASTGDDRESSFQVLETAVLNAGTVNESRFRFLKSDSDQTGKNASAIINVAGAFTSGGSAAGASFSHQNRYEVQNFTSSIRGPHTMKIGGILRAITLADQAMQNYSGTFTFTSLSAYRSTLLGIRQGLSPEQIRTAGGGASQFTLTAGDPLASLSQLDYGLFAQDDWRIRANLTLSAGLRYEAQTHVQGAGDWAPRVDIAWAPGQSKNVIRAGVGIFYERLSESYSLEALRQNGVQQQQFLIENPDFFPAIPLPAAPPQIIRATDPHWRAPRLVQEGIGYERALPRHVTASVNYLHTKGTRALRSTNTTSGLNSVYRYETTGIYRQNQLVTKFNARVNAKLSFTASYILGDARSNTDGGATFAANPNDLSTEYGPAGFNVRHRFQGYGTWTTKWNIGISPFITVNSGRPYNITTGTDLNNDGLYTDRPALATDPTLPGLRSTIYGLLDPNPKPGEKLLIRNAGTGPWAAAPNLRVSKSFNIGRHQPGKDSEKQLNIGVNARNFINHPNLQTPTGNLSSPFFGRSTTVVQNGNGISPNRRIDLQIRFTF